MKFKNMGHLEWKKGHAQKLNTVDVKLIRYASHRN